MPNKKRSVSKTKNYVLIAIVLAVLAGVIIIAPQMGGKRSIASAVELPTWLKQYPPEVREAYAYAAEHQDMLKFMACYCGCQNHGHDSNAACYVKDIGPDGKIEWDSHAAT